MKRGASTRGRRVVNFWGPFNQWWRTALESSGKRPSGEEIMRWYTDNAEHVWPIGQPSLQECKTHAKCLRSVDAVRDYFRKYREVRRDGQAPNKDYESDGYDEENERSNHSQQLALGSHGGAGPSRLRYSSLPCSHYTPEHHIKDETLSNGTDSKGLWQLERERVPLAMPFQEQFNHIQGQQPQVQQQSSEISAKKNTKVCIVKIPAKVMARHKQMSVLRPPLSAVSKGFASKPDNNFAQPLHSGDLSSSMTRLTTQQDWAMPSVGKRRGTAPGGPQVPPSVQGHDDALWQRITAQLPQLSQIQVKPTLSLKNEPDQECSPIGDHLHSISKGKNKAGTPLGLLLDTMFVDSPSAMDLSILLSENHTPMLGSALSDWSGASSQLSQGLEASQRSDCAAGIASGRSLHINEQGNFHNFPSPQLTVNYHRQHFHQMSPLMDHLAGRNKVEHNMHGFAMSEGVGYLPQRPMQMHNNYYSWVDSPRQQPNSLNVSAPQQQQQQQSTTNFQGLPMLPMPMFFQGAPFFTDSELQRFPAALPDL